MVLRFIILSTALYIATCCVGCSAVEAPGESIEAIGEGTGKAISGTGEAIDSAAEKERARRRAAYR